MSDPVSLSGTAVPGDEGAAYLESILASSHPLMVEAFYVAAIPYWYDQSLFAAIRRKDDGRTEALIELLSQYSFISPLTDREEGEPSFAVRGRERDAFHRYWIAEDPALYREAHRRALAYWQAEPDRNAFAQAQNLVYHGLLADFERAVELLISRFRTYRNERQFAAIERLLDAGREAREYLVLLEDGRVSELDDLLEYLLLRLAQLREDWKEAEDHLAKLLADPGPDKRLRPYVERAKGHTQLHEDQYEKAIKTFKRAIKGFDKQLSLVGKEVLFQPEEDIRAERAYALIELGQAHVDLAEFASGQYEREVPPTGRWWRLRAVGALLLSLPLILYLAVSLGRPMLQPRFWFAVLGLDWIIARLFATGAGYYRKADADLERYGEPIEGTIADEERGRLYLALGHAWEAQRLYRPLAEAQVPLGPYRQAAAQVGLAEACLRLGQAAEAARVLRAALPVLKMYEARDLQARAEELLGGALLATGQQMEAIDRLETACQHYQRTDAWEEATRLTEHLGSWMQSGRLGDEVRDRARNLIEGLRQRHYPGRYRQPWLVRFRKVALLGLPIVLLLAPLLTITLETGVALTPEIRFRPAPILNPVAVVSTNLSQGIARADVYRVVVSDTLLWLAVGLLLAYLVFSFLLGLAALVFTPLRKVEVRGRGATVCLDDERLAMGFVASGCLDDPPSPATQEAGVEAVAWTGISQFVQADVQLWDRPMGDASAFGVAATSAPLVVGGSTTWYSSLRERVRERVSGRRPASAKVVNLDYAILRSPMGVLYLLSLVYLGILGLAALARGEVIFYDLPGTPYSAADLYPYLYLFLVVAPLWWAVVQPLRRRLHLQPRSGLPLVVLGVGLALAIVQVFIRFRPLLTVLNLYVPLTTLILLVSAEAVVWRAQVAGQKVYPAAVRIGSAALVAAACLLMVSTMWRDTRAYHHLVQGKTLGDQALKDRAPQPSERAIPRYQQAADVGSQPIWGIATKAAARIRVGVPPASRFTWISALTGRAALEARIGHYDEATLVYTEALSYTDRPDQIYAWLAVAGLSQATETGTRESLEVDQEQYRQAIEHLDDAIELAPHVAAYHLWRGVAYHALAEPRDCTYAAPPGERHPLIEAANSYNEALAWGKEDPDFAAGQRERALSGLGWISYMCEDYEEALQCFQLATGADPESAEARVGKGYALYALEDFEKALNVWEFARVLQPEDPTILLALGTAHWKLGRLADELPERTPCSEYELSAEYFAQATDRENLWPQSDQEVAFTYRTMAYVQYLIGNKCAQPGRVAMYDAAIDSFSKAIALDPQRPEYWYRRGRIAYAIWLVLKETASPEAGPCLQAKCLSDALADLAKTHEIDERRDYEANTMIEDIRGEALGRGDKVFADGEYEHALAYYELVANDAADDARAAFKAGLASLALGQADQALSWYRAGLERARTLKDPEAGTRFDLKEKVEDAIEELQAVVDAQPDLAPAAQPILDQLEALR